MANSSASEAATNFSTHRISIEQLETGPIFVNMADQVAFTMFAFLAFLLVYLLNGTFIALFACNKQLQTPYFTILVIHAIYDLVMSATAYLSVIYISISGSNPYRGNRTMCLLHRMFSMMPFLSKVHSMILLSLERLIFFYQPFWYLRMVTIPRIIIVECILLVISMIFSSLTTGIGEIYFSPALLICSNLTKPWVWSSQMSLYYAPDILFMAATIAALYRLILKQRRAIACAALPTQREQPTQSNANETTSGPSDTVPATSAHQTDAPDIERRRSNDECVVANIKAAIKLVSGISGVFWFTFVPAVIGINVIRSRNLLVEAEMAWNVEARMMLRFISYLTTLAWIADPIMFFLVNPKLRSTFLQLFRK